MARRPRKFIAYTFTVEGRSPFPLDMLRYDRACPYHVDDVAPLATPSREPRRVSLIAFTPYGNAPAPTSDRWITFGWSVIPDSIRVINDD